MKLNSGLEKSECRKFCRSLGEIKPSSILMSPIGVPSVLRFHYSILSEKLFFQNRLFAF